MRAVVIHRVVRRQALERIINIVVPTIIQERTLHAVAPSRIPESNVLEVDADVDNRQQHTAAVVPPRHTRVQRLLRPRQHRIHTRVPTSSVGMHLGNRRHIDAHHLLQRSQRLNPIHGNPRRQQTVLETALHPHAQRLQRRQVAALAKAHKRRNEPPSVHRHRCSIAAANLRRAVTLRPQAHALQSPTADTLVQLICGRPLLQLAQQHPRRSRQLRAHGSTLRKDGKGNSQQEKDEKHAFHIQ